MINIALVDDENSIRTSVSLALQSEGFNVDVFKNGIEALEALESKQYDLGLFDIPGILNDLPFTVLDEVEREKAEELKNRFEDADCVVELVNTSELK